MKKPTTKDGLVTKVKLKSTRKLLPLNVRILDATIQFDGRRYYLDAVVRDLKTGRHHVVKIGL